MTSSACRRHWFVGVVMPAGLSDGGKKYPAAGLKSIPPAGPRGMGACGRRGRCRILLHGVALRTRCAAPGGEAVMCGIVGYVGRRNAVPLLVDGLKRLEYRGYDSAGLAVLEKGRVAIRKQVGRLSVLEEELGRRPVAGAPGIGHTRWATHGEPSEINSHPHTRFRRPDRRRPQRHHRELPGAATGPGAEGRTIPVGNGHRSDPASDRARN